MKLKPVTVIFNRTDGILCAHVLMGGFHGTNLLSERQITRVDSAKEAVAQILAADGIEVGEWREEASQPTAKTQEVTPISTKRDAYGWRSMPSGSRFLGDPKKRG